MTSGFFNKNFYINLSLIFLIFISDRLSKIYIINESVKNLDNFILESSYLNIRLIWNEGIAFGLFSFETNLYYNLISFLIGAIILLIVIISKKSKGIEKISFLMIIGGALGNLFDRYYYKSVIDFIDFSFQNFHWFIFNVSDIFISLGVVILILLEFKKKNE